MIYASTIHRRITPLSLTHIHRRISSKFFIWNVGSFQISSCFMQRSGYLSVCENVHVDAPFVVIKCLKIHHYHIKKEFTVICSRVSSPIHMTSPDVGDKYDVALLSLSWCAIFSGRNWCHHLIQPGIRKSFLYLAPRRPISSESCIAINNKLILSFFPLKISLYAISASD